MNIMKRKRWRLEEDDNKSKNWGKLEKVISEIVENEKHRLKEELCEHYKDTYREVYREYDELKKSTMRWNTKSTVSNKCTTKQLKVRTMS